MKRPKLDAGSMLGSMISGLAVNIAWQIGVALMPSFLAVLYSLLPTIRRPGQTDMIWVLAVGWSASGILAAVWFRNHTKRRRERVRDLLSKMFSADRGLNSLIAESFGTLEKPQVEQRITMLLMHMCDILAYRLNAARKGATFLVLSDDTDAAHFEMFAQVRHDDDAIPHEVKEQLTKRYGLAGQSVRTSTCIVLPDCRRPPQGIEWVNTHDPPRYIGRVAAPVQAIRENQSKDIGALCFDIAVPWTLSQEDVMLMTAIADKIASIWILYQPNRANSLARNSHTSSNV